MLNPAQCPEHALMARIPLGLGPSLHQLRSRSLCLVRGLHSYYGSGFQRLLTIAFRPALRFDVRYLIWEVSLSVSGGIASPRMTTCGPRSDAIVSSVQGRRPPPLPASPAPQPLSRAFVPALDSFVVSMPQPHPKNCIARPKNCAASIPNGLFTCSPFDLSHRR